MTPEKVRKKLRIFLKNETQQPCKTKPIRDDRKSAQKWTFFTGQKREYGLTFLA